MATIPSAQQPGATSALKEPIQWDKAKLSTLGVKLSGRFTQYEMDRRLAELKWARNARQYLGIYDPEIETKMDVNRSRAYPKTTRVKCVSMLSRLMNLLFQADDKNWGVGASAVPDLSQEDLQSVLDQLAPPPAQSSAQPGMAASPPPPPTGEQIEQAIRVFAKKRAARLETEIEDQLQELGGSRAIDYVALCRKVLASGIQYGMGVLKGPYVEEQEQRKWEQGDDGRMQAIPFTAMRPRFEFVPLWDYYPDMSAKYIAQMEGQFQRVVMSKHQVAMLKQRPDFIKDQVDDFLKGNTSGNYVRRAFETELRAMGVQVNVTQAARNKYEAIVWEGYVSGQELADCGVPVPDDQMTGDVRANVWLMGNTVVKAEIDPWSELDTDGEMPMYHHFIFEEDESTLLGNGLPNIMRDSQMGICAGTRMIIDNGSVQRMFEVNTALLGMNQDVTSMQADKVFIREDDDPRTLNYPAIRTIDVPTNQAEYQRIVEMFQGFADQETFVNAATGGDMQKGPSEPFRTAAGASMLRGDAALPFKDVVRNFDIFTESVIGAMIVFNKNFNPNPDIQGDFQPVARGATSLIAKEVLGVQLDSFAQTLTPEEKPYIKFRELARARARVRDLIVEDIVVDDATADQIDQQQQATAQAQSQQQDQMTQAQIREMLAKALKEISAAGLNTAKATATSANVILDSLQKGLNPDELPGAGPAAPASPDATAQPAVAAPQPVQGFADGGIVGRAMPTFSYTPPMTDEAPSALNTSPVHGLMQGTGVGAESVIGSLSGGSGLNADSTVHSLMQGSIFSRYAEGGMITGPGTGTSDSIPIAASKGEFVVPADVVRKVGPGALQTMVNTLHKPKG